jgi:ParB family transcriptional regulator, chromosome partitioning protein
LSVALIENLQRTDLSPIEETEGILELLSMQPGRATRRMKGRQ